jgi:hypothetical protein
MVEMKWWKHQQNDVILYNAETSSTCSIAVMQYISLYFDVFLISSHVSYVSMLGLIPLAEKNGIQGQMKCGQLQSVQNVPWHQFGKTVLQASIAILETLGFLLVTFLFP